MYDLVFYNKKYNNEICRLSFNNKGTIAAKRGDDSWLDYTYQPVENGVSVNFEQEPLRWGEAMVASYATNEHVKAVKESSTLNAPPVPVSPETTTVSEQESEASFGWSLLATFLAHFVTSLLAAIVFFLIIVLGVAGVASANSDSLLALSASVWIMIFLLFVPAMLAFSVWLEIKFVAAFSKRILSIGSSIVAMVVIPLVSYIVVSILALAFAPLAFFAPVVAIVAGALFVQKKARKAVTSTV